MADLEEEADLRELDDLVGEKSANSLPGKGQSDDKHAFINNYYAQHSTSTKIIKTVATILGCSSMGIYAEIVGPTIPDLKDRVNASYEEIARTLVARSVGYCVGAVVGGALAHRNPLHLEALVFLSCLFGALGSAVVPWCKDLWVLGVMLHIEGWGQAFINTGTDTMVLGMWGKHAATPVHALHFGFGIGAVLAPQLARPFIAERNVGSKTADNVTVNGNVFNTTPPVETTSLPFSNSSQHWTEERPPGLDSDIHIPYMISAAYSFVFFVIFLLFYLKGAQRRKAYESEKPKTRKEKKQNFLQAISPGSCTGGNASYGCMFFCLLFLYYGNIVGGERAIGRFIFSYAIDSEQSFSVSDAALLNSVFWIGFTSGRGLSSILAYCCSPFVLVMVEIIINIICGLALTIWGLTVPGVLWAFTGILGLFLSPIFPGGLAWSNLYVEMKGLAITVVYIGASIGAIIYQWLTGYLFDYEGPATLMYVMLGYALLMALIFIFMVIVVRPHGKRFDTH